MTDDSTFNSTSTRNYTTTDQQSPAEAVCAYFQQYAREKPEVVALWALGIGFVLGWKLKPW